MSVNNKVKVWITVASIAFLFLSLLPCAEGEKLTEEQSAQQMIQVSGGLLAPVYAPIAAQIVTDYDLAARDGGIGVDLGGGPGALILELCKRTKLHWINADINPYFFAPFFAEAATQGVAHQISAIWADAQKLPFCNNYADILVSRGTYRFIEDKQKAFAEIYRVLKPGGVAYVGRGFARNMPITAAQVIRKKQGESMCYDREEAARELTTIMEALKIRTYRIEIPVHPEDESLNYGIWIEIKKELE